MENHIEKFKEKLNKNGIDIREKFLKDPSGIYVGEVANTHNDLFRAQVLETKNGVVYQFQPIRQDKVSTGPVISIPELVLDEVLPDFAQKMVTGEMLAKETAKKILTRDLAQGVIAQGVGQELGRNILNQAIQENETGQQEKEVRKQQFFQRKAGKEAATNQKISQIFDGKITFTQELPTRNLPALNKMNPEEMPRPETKKPGGAAPSRKEALKAKEASGIQDARKRYDEQQREEAKNAQQQQEAQRAEQRRQQVAQQKQKSAKSSSISWVKGGAIGAGIAIGVPASFTLLFS